MRATDDALVVDVVLGLSEGTAAISRAFGDVRAEMASAVRDDRDAVEDGEFPAEEHSHCEPGLDDVY